MTTSNKEEQQPKSSFLGETIQLLSKECLQECRKPHIQKQIQEVICDPLLEYCIQQLTPYYLLLVIIFIVLLIVIAILLAFIIFTFSRSGGNSSAI